MGRGEVTARRCCPDDDNADAVDLTGDDGVAVVMVWATLGCCRGGFGRVGRAGRVSALPGESCSFSGGLNFCDDLRGGGLGGRGESLFFLIFSFLSPPRTVPFDDEDDEFRDSRIAAKVWVVVPAPIPPISLDESFPKLPALPRLACHILGAEGMRTEDINPGDCDEIDVGVVSRL